ncbi:hypothetical protein V6N12_026266 [Hibiscus sabdariffa]|uniref:AP2/ERF and B3 domain-containing transcription factor n=1 Tax=Hibiscus sabdariffa TaxID=183260 RepID=A0ABR2DSE3_9ROSI
MEEEILSVISSGSDVSDSVSTTHQGNKRRRWGGNGNSSQYKGVMRQKNGQWGAQLYANHARIWLGTFRSEIDAAMAYDSASIKFGTGDTHRNFPWTEITTEEPKFLSYYSTEAVLGMIRDGSYQYKFMEYIKVRSRVNAKPDVDINSMGTYIKEGLIFKQLFGKELTPSDVSKLNRLVVPKKYAVKYFPPVPGDQKQTDADISDHKTNDVELVFYDKFMRLWKFRYCYWASSQSFVFTRGWSQFLKEKQLKAKDMISFYLCEGRKANEVRRFCMIDVNKSRSPGATFLEGNNVIGREVDLQLRLGQFDGEKQEQRSMAAAKIYCFDALTLDNKFSVLTYPVPQAGGQGMVGMSIGYGPMAVGSRWLAYASNNPLQSNTGGLSPQNLTPSAGVSPSTSPSSGNLVARCAMESSKQSALGLINLGDMGYRTLSKYYQDLVPDGSSSPVSSNSGWKVGRAASHSAETIIAGMILHLLVYTPGHVVQYKLLASFREEAGENASRIGPGSPPQAVTGILFHHQFSIEWNISLKSSLLLPYMQMHALVHRKFRKLRHPMNMEIRAIFVAQPTWARVQFSCRFNLLELSQSNTLSHRLGY